jgi:uncharacterized protein (DUF433 family)
VDCRERIIIDPGMRGGKPCMRSMRITVYDLISRLASGKPQEEVLADFLCLKTEDILASLAFAAGFERSFVAEPSL